MLLRQNLPTLHREPPCSPPAALLSGNGHFARSQVKSPVAAKNRVICLLYRYYYKTMKKRRESARQSSMSRSSMAAEADWSELQSDILNLISQRIDNEIDLIRFRSICSNWRSSSVPNHHTNILPFKFPLLTDDSSSDFDSDDNFINYEFSDSINNINDTNFPFAYLSKRSVLLIKPPQQQQQQQQNQTLFRPWLARITQNSSGKIKIFELRFPWKTLFPYSNGVLDFNELSVVHLRTDFMIDERTLPDDHYESGYTIPEAVLAVTCHGKKPVVLGALSYVVHCPMLFRGLDERWTPISSSTYYGDTCMFKGRIYAVNLYGQTVVIGPESRVQLVAQPFVSDVTRKLMVESEGELLLVNICESFPNFSIDLFQLDEKEKKWVRLGGFDEQKNKWVKLRDIGDRVLFLRPGCSFSAYASELGLPRGNSVVFIDESVLSLRNHRNHVFHLDHDRLSPVSEFEKYLELFLPPEWIKDPQKLNS